MPRFSLKTLLIAVAAFAICTGVWSQLFRKVAHFRPPHSDDRLGAWGSRPGRTTEEGRRVARAVGRFDERTRLLASLETVQAGKHHESCWVTLQLFSNERVTFPSKREITYVFGTEKTPQGKFTVLDSQSDLMTANGGGVAPLLEIPARYTYSYTGTITPGQRHIVYAEGDAPINVHRNMTMTEFATSHPGNYSVLVAEFESP